MSVRLKNLILTISSPAVVNNLLSAIFVWLFYYLIEGILIKFTDIANYEINYPIGVILGVTIIMEAAALFFQIRIIRADSEHYDTNKSKVLVVLLIIVHVVFSFWFFVFFLNYFNVFSGMKILFFFMGLLFFIIREYYFTLKVLEKIDTYCSQELTPFLTQAVNLLILISTSILFAVYWNQILLGAVKDSIKAFIIEGDWQSLLFIIVFSMLFFFGTRYVYFLEDYYRIKTKTEKIINSISMTALVLSLFLQALFS